MNGPGFFCSVRPAPFTARRGFALLITVTLLAFLVVLLVGLAGYVRVETAVAGNTQRQAQARQNARLALDVALGQLQKYAGPDQRVTATAESFGGEAGTRHYTGVWQVEPAAPSPALLTWLVSGNELPDAPLAVRPTTSWSTNDAVELVGAQTSGTAREVVARLQPVTTVGAPGSIGATPVTIGRYAWWVGDQGVKAPVAVSDDTARIDYAPWDSAELRRRLRQQTGLGAGAANPAGTPIFEPHDPANAPLVASEKIIAFNQLAFLRDSAAAAIGPARLKAYFHAWSPNNFAVLANTRLGGLRQDLSLDPTLLGPAFAAWADYASYMEDPLAPGTPAPLPAYGADPLRRRYRITPAVSAGNAGVAPVLTYFYLLLGVRKANGGSPYTLGLRWAAGLSNLYTSALVPEDLRLEISGLPPAVSIRARAGSAPAGSGTTDATVSLAGLYGNPLKVKLPWDFTTAPTGDKASWLPGRTYNWVSTADRSFTAGATNPGRFYSRAIPSLANGLVVSVAGSLPVNGSSLLTLNIPASTTLTVKVVRDRDGQVLATYTSPTYQPVPTTDEFQASGNTSPVGFIFRLAESFDTVATDPGIWLRTAGRDPRFAAIDAAALTTSPKSTAPTDCKNFTTISVPERFFDRDITSGTSYNEDVPVFELPRSPLLSLGALQHFAVPAARPFAIGNSWGAQAAINGVNGGALFDQFFFSGLVAGVTPTPRGPGWLLPNPLLKSLPRNPATGAALSVADLRGVAGARSSKFLLQSAAFNVNSVNPAAWAAVLRAGRLVAPITFTYLKPADQEMSTADDASTAASESTDAQFFRFPQSAQEVFNTDEGYGQSTTSTAAGPVIDAPLFRRGRRTLDAGQVAALAKAIADAVAQQQATSGPFPSLEDFLRPSPRFVDSSGRTVSLLEKAIEAAGINSTVAEFSSQWLTQGDLLTALAPVLFPRSDTFLIRTYGEAVNPTTGATEARAWCEATVQRGPDYFDPSAVTGDAPEVAPAALKSTLNQTFGRRFKIVSFRWLTRSDL